MGYSNQILQEELTVNKEEYEINITDRGQDVMNEIDNFEKLLDEFKQIPKFIPQKTYLDICKYPGSRFEEICSRILAFFFKPTNEHGLSDLFLQSLLETNPKENKIRFVSQEVEVDTEVQTKEGKRLDILISSKDFIIGIENKIFASLYNPLETYHELIQEKTGNDGIPAENIFKIVLSVKKVTDQNELMKMERNGFVKVYYSTFFEKLKKNVGEYLTQANPRYVTFMYDFIQTVENMEGKFDNKMFRFFTENKGTIDELVSLYDNYKQQILVAQKDRISEILYAINAKTNDNWWTWQGWILVFDRFNVNTTLPRIGIEANYEFYNNNPLGLFKIFIVTWKKEDFLPYEGILMKKYPNKFLDKNSGIGNKVYLRLDVIKDDNENEILERLKFHYDEMKKIIADLPNI